MSEAIEKYGYAARYSRVRVENHSEAVPKLDTCRTTLLPATLIVATRDKSYSDADTL